MTVEEALVYTKPNGYRHALAIFPLRRGTKYPAIPKAKGGHGCLDATLDITIIQVWWKKYPESNVGIATGAINGIIAIDVDINHSMGKYGDESLMVLENRYGKLPESWEQMTPNGGRHLIFKMPEGVDIRNSEGKESGEGIAPWIDVRANGGYIVGCPSKTDVGRYEWEASSVPSETPLAELPPAWIELLQEKSGPKKQSKTFKLPDTVKKGSRNRTMFQFAASMRAKGVDESTMLQSMKRENEARFVPPLDENEIEKIFDSVLKYPAGTPKQDSKPALTLELLEQWLADNGIRVRRNVISHSLCIEGIGPEFDAETISGDLHIIIHDKLKRDFKCDRSLVADLLGVVAGKNRFNPVLDMLNASPPWDGADRINEIYSILGVPEADTLSRVLILKWLQQTRSIVENEVDTAFGADGVLVLSGPQGCGKTTFCRTIAGRPEFVKLGQYIDSKDKDTIRRVTSAWISELGEVETTLRSDLERLKGFITAEIDEYRLPYGRADVCFVRRTSLIATCNSERFLIDPTGSRRFWTIPLTHIDLPALAALDVLQLWRQVEIQVKANPQCFRLTPLEQARLAERNTAHEKPLKSQPEVADILADADGNANYNWAYMTVTAFKALYPVLGRYSVEQVSKALDKLGIPMQKKRVDGKPSRVRLLPQELRNCGWHSA